MNPPTGEKAKRDSSVTSEYPRVLDAEGCIYGQQTRREITVLVERVERLEKKFDRMILALVAASISFASLTLSLWLK